MMWLMPALVLAWAQERAKPWIDMDYGPFLTATIQAAPGNIARKGVAIRLDDGPGGVSAGAAFLLFDTDTLRAAAGWTGRGFIDWRNVAFDGAHEAWASIVGSTLFTNPDAPGWDVEDARIRGRDGRPYGPLPRESAHWRGLYVHGRRVVLSYSIAEVAVLESPAVESGAITRSFDVGPRSRAMSLQVSAASVEPAPVQGRALPPVLLQRNEPVFAMATGLPAGASWIFADDGRLRLTVPAGPEPLRFKVSIGRAADAAAFARTVLASAPLEALEPLTRGGPARWPEPIVEKCSPLETDDGPFVVESLGTPMENPYRAWMRPGGFDFFPGGRRAAVCTWNGDVWTVDGLDDSKGVLRWRRIAAGLFQPLGLRILDGTIYVLGRDQITRLRDLNADGEPDFYENFNSDAQVTEHFHEFAGALQTDAQGNFYVLKAGRHALDSVVPHHGTLLKIDKEGRRTEILANGFRAPNGLALAPDGAFVGSDQEGHWTPANRINWIKPGGFYGYRWSFPRGEHPADFAPPLCWIKGEFDRSPSEQVFVPAGTWGPLAGKLLGLSYGTGRIYLVMHESIDGLMQGGVAHLPMPVFPTGLVRGRFHPTDGRLYVCGLFGWSSDRTFPGGFYRIRYAERPLRAPLELHALRGALRVRFSDPLDRARAADARRYRAERWNYRYTENYGSKDYRVSDDALGRDDVEIASARVSRDGRSVLLQIPNLAPCMQMKLTYRLQTEDGARLAGEIMHTIHALGAPERYRAEFD
jgi:glucose/arabinose dehydrogenase